MKRVFVAAATAAVLLAASSAPAPTVVWPMYGHDAQHTGVSHYAGPLSPVIKWSYNTGGLILSSPVIGSDGTLYLGSGYAPSNRFSSFNSNGTLRWSYTPVCFPSSSAAVSDGTVYMHAQGDPFFRAFSSLGTLRWSYQMPSIIGDSSPTIGSDMTIYLGSQGDNGLYAFTSAGMRKWSYRTGNQVWTSPAIGPDGTIYFGSNDNSLYAVDSVGGFRWSYSTGAPVQYSSPTCYNPDGTLFVGSNDNRLYAVRSNGGIKWSYVVGAPVENTPSLGSDGTVYLGCHNQLYAFNSNSTVRWSYSTGSSIYKSSPAIGSDGTIYFGSYDNTLYVVNSKGGFRWSYRVGSAVTNSPVIGSDGTLYFGSGDNSLYALGAGAIPPTPTPVPTAVLVANKTVLNRGERLVVDFRLNQAIARKFDVWAAIVFPDGSMIGTEDFLPGPEPLAFDVQGLNPPFEYNLLDVTVPEGTPPGVYEIVVCFFDSDSGYSRREDAFYQVSVKITVQ